MKNFKRIFALTFSIIILAINFSFLAADTVSADTVRYGEGIITEMKNSTALKHVYNKLVEGCKNSEAEITFDYQKYSITAEEFNKVYKFFLNDYPEYFWINYLSNDSYMYTVGNSVCAFYPKYWISGNALAKAKSSFNSRVEGLTADLNGKSDYEKSLILHDRLAELVDYQETSNDQNAYGALVEKSAVCAGYARAYQLLLLKSGIPAWYVTGYSENPATHTDVGHAWNLVQIDGKWYYTDVTWDDQPDILFYAYFNGTKEQFDKGHSPESDIAPYLPTATSTEANYFYKNSLVYNNFDKNKIGTELKNNNLTTRIFVNGDVYDFYDKIKLNVLPIAQAAGLPYRYGASIEPHILGNEIILKMRFIDPDHICKPTLVKRVEPTCTSKGSKEYYKCSCGEWYSSDKANQNTKIEDKQSVILSAVSHKPSGWKTHATDHYKECTVCGVHIAGSIQDHKDSNKDYKCDVCGYALPKPQAKPPASSPSSKNESTQSNNTTTANSSQILSSDSSQQSDISSETDISSEENTDSSAISKKPSKKAPFNKKLIIPIISGGVILIGGGIAAAIFFVKRK